ncbi:mechanosensitive ion channel domain-containing protein [uncultured Lacinutrix sp.]|uniref:mechanosensitive ion channel domain-containing protein n=1 Tax=uncultured Lacinutrix sp. TaxID=574032 RepID=UPI002605C08D|nr:mechanosensitive ion channel domain-containing protein [uncultured Lacinutrix sp.]
MNSFLKTYQNELINSLIVFGIFFIVQFIVRLILRRIGKSKLKNIGRIKLIGRYVTVTFLMIALLVEAFVLGVNIEDLVVVFSSVFAILGITLFANWSILSNVTSGIVMFFSFPYKIGDKIQIHDKELEITAVIEDIRSFQLHLRKENGDLVTYPNNLLLQKAVTLLEKNAVL